MRNRLAILTVTAAVVAGAVPSAYAAGIAPSWSSWSNVSAGQVIVASPDRSSWG